jgi:hypothetical protein
MRDGVEGVLMEEAEDMDMVGARVIAEKAEDIAAEAEMGEGEVIKAMKLGQQIKGDGVI